MQLNELLQQYEKSTGLHKLPTVEEISAMTLDEKKELSAKLAWGLSRNISTTLKDNFVYQGKYSNMSDATKSELYQAILDLGTNNEIWYTQWGGGVLTPPTIDFGANIIKNKYTQERGGIITFDNSVTKIGKNAFKDCSKLQSIKIPSSVTSIGESAFDGCLKLKSINSKNDDEAIIPSSVTSIGKNAFNGCPCLTKIEIPNSVTSIGESAFKDCPSLTKITVLNPTPASLGSAAFDDTNDCPIYVPAESVDAYKAATNWSTYAARIQAIPE